MPRFLIAIIFAILTMGACLALPADTTADTYYTAVLDGPTAGTPSTATGTAVLTLNSAETEVTYVIEYSALVGNETVAHIHNAPPGVIGPVFHFLEFGSPKTGVWEVGPFEVAELNAGRVNILIHSDLYPASEIRGDVEFHSVAPAESPSDGGLPPVLVLRGNHPNPFNPLTTISFGIPREGRVEITVYDTRGRLVRRLMDDDLTAGYHTVTWNGLDDGGSRVGSGTYLYRVVTAGMIKAGKMSLTK